MSPFIDVVAAYDDDVQPDAETTERAAKSRRLCSWFIDLLRLDHQKVDVGVRSLLAAGAGTEKDHLRAGRGDGESTAELLDQLLTIRRAGRLHGAEGVAPGPDRP